MKKIASYILSAYSFVFNNPLEKILDAGYQSKNGNPIPSFDEKLLIDLCTEAQNIFANESNILEINDDVIVVGDIHGSLHDLLRILHFFYENKSKILFLGDYVDRGHFSLECITLLFALKVIRPDIFFLIRGNHEFDALCSQYGFKEEILNHHSRKRITNATNPNMNNDIDSIIEKEEQRKQYEEYLSDHHDMNCYKYSELLYNSFINTFAYLPIGAIVNKSTFCIHGGLSPRMEVIESLTKSIKRPIFNFEENNLLSDIVWSDPSGNASCLYGDNPRGKGYLFNRSAVSHFLQKNSINRIIRAHECVKNGYFKQFNDKLITVFSASSYDYNLGNKSAVLQLFPNDNDDLKIIVFDPIERLQKCDAFFYKIQPFGKKELKLPAIYSFHHPFLTSNSGLRVPINKKMNLIPHQSSSRGFCLNDLHSKTPLIKKTMLPRSSSMRLSDLKNGNKKCSLLAMSDDVFAPKEEEEMDEEFQQS